MFLIRTKQTKQTKPREYTEGRVSTYLVGVLKHCLSRQGETRKLQTQVELKLERVVKSNMESFSMYAGNKSKENVNRRPDAQDSDEGH